ncbi:MAG: ATP-binding protein [Symploca sp. SIO2G7]|nr:ATP-binding protein [Symploca sp. SIO2G7]
MTSDQLFGDFPEEILTNYKLLIMEFFIQSIPPERWKQTRYLSIAFITDYLSNIFPVDEENIKSYQQQLQMKSAASYIANELLENSMKFHYGAVNYPVRFGIGFIEQSLVFVGSNCTSPQNLESFTNFVQELTTSDIDELYFRQIEKGAEENSEESRLGFLSMINDYNAKLGWKIETLKEDPEIATITTMVQLTTELSK